MNLVGETYSYVSSSLPQNCPTTTSPYCQGNTTVNTTRSDAFVANLIQGGTSPVNEVSNSNTELLIYPNPSSGFYTIDLSSSSNENIQLEVFNLLGESVILQKGFAHKGKNQYNIDLTSMANGIYFVCVQTKAYRVTGKIIKN